MSHGPILPYLLQSDGKPKKQSHDHIPSLEHQQGDEVGKEEIRRESHDGKVTGFPLEQDPHGDMALVPKLSTTKQSSTTRKKLDYVDGLRGIAVILIFNAHFIDLTFRTQHPTVIEQGTPVAILRHLFALSLFFALSGYLNSSTWFRRKVQGRSHGLELIPEALFRRVIRLSSLVIFGAMMQQAECAGGAFTATIAAEKVLQSKVLGYPQWCAIALDGPNFQLSGHTVTVGRAFATIIKVFTSRDHLTMLLTTSMLWTMYSQLWGTIFCLLLILVVVPMKSTAMRYWFYLFLILSLMLTYHEAFPFVSGVVLADLKFSGHLKRFNRWSRSAYIITETLLVALMAIMLCYNPVPVAFQRWIASFGIRDGLLSWNAGASDFQTDKRAVNNNQSIITIQAFLFFLWVEMSPVLQWLVGNFFFSAIGRVAFGMYVAQMSVIYGIMPHLILYFDARPQSYTYWGMISTTWLLTFLSNYVFGWLLSKFIDEPFNKFESWLLNAIKSFGVSGLAKHSGSTILTFIVSTVPNGAKSLPGKGCNGWRAFKTALWQTWNWRQPSEVPAPRQEPAFYGLDATQLHSTQFDKSLYVGDVRAERTYKLLRAWSYIAPLNTVMIALVMLVWLFYNPWHSYVITGFAAFSTLWRVLWLLALPYCIITFIGYAIPDVTLSQDRQNKQKVHRDTIHRLFILSVTRGSNEEATRRSHSVLKTLERFHPAVRVVVLTDEPYAYPDLDNVMTPKDYRTATGAGKHKAKALDYFRTSMNLTPYDYVLHMDEESTMDAETLRGCFKFIRYSPHHMGQGIITYNSNGFFEGWRGWCFSVADTIRVGDDLARFSLQTNIIKRPVFGVHGSFLLLSGEVENSVTWDFGSLAEDFELSQAAWKKGYTLGRIHGIVREQSPQGFKDFMKQRRRWYIGIRTIEGIYMLPALAIKLWTSGIFCLIATIINVLFSLLLQWSGSSPWWVYANACFCFGCFIWLYYGGLLFSELDYGYSTRSTWKPFAHAFALFFLQPIMAVLEGASVIWAMSTEDNEVTFEVIKK